MMVLLKVAFLAVVLLQGKTDAQQQYIWNGGTTNFSDPLNWKNLLPPAHDGSITPCSTTAGAMGLNIVSNLDVNKISISFFNFSFSFVYFLSFLVFLPFLFLNIFSCFYL